MLSRLHDERVFTSSHDVVFSEASARDAQQRLLGTAQATTPRGMRKQLTRRQRQQIANGDAEHKVDDSDESGGESSSGDGNSDDAGDEGDDADDDEEEEELLRNSRHPPSSRYHPQHPYNAQLFALAKKKQKPVNGDVLARNDKSAAAFVYENHYPMEFVYLPSGEIRPRDECPPGLALPPPATQASITAESQQQLLAENAFADRGGMQRQQQQQRLSSAPTAVRASSKPETSRRAAPATKITDSATAASQRPGASISIVGYTKKEHVPRRSRSSSESSEEDSDSSSARYQSLAAKRRNNNNVDASPGNESSASEASDASASFESEDEEKENVRRQESARGSTQKQRVVEISSVKRDDVNTSKPVTASTTRTTSSISRIKSAEPASRKLKKKSEHSKAQPQLEVEVSEEQHQPIRRGKLQTEYPQPSTHEKHRKAPLPSPSSASDASQTVWARRPKAVKYEDLQTKPAHTEDGKQQKKSTKMDVRDLLSENSRVKVLKSKPSREQSEKIEFLEQELQKEKKRVLEKMTQLLEEQGKNQQLQHQVDGFQSQLASKERDAEVKVKEVLRSKDDSLGQVETQWKARVKALEDQLHAKDAAVARLQSETEQLKNTMAKLKDRERQTSSQSKEKETSANHQFEKILAKLKKFRVRVENWKANSKEAMEVCDRKSDLLSLMDTLWLDFPAFPSFLDANGESKSSNGEKRGDTSDNANMILFLKKRLRLREDELHQTHVKYVELKELCARQCVREADLQNFINEHRLRGNLIIRKDGTTPAKNNANDGRRNVQFQEQQQQQRSETKKKAIVNRGTNTSPTYYEEDESDEEDREEYEDYEEDDGEQAADDDEEEQQEEYYVREPKVFVQVGRDGVYEHAPSRSSAVLRKLEEDQTRHARKKKEAREVERIRLVPSPTLARRYERVPAPSEEYVVATARRKVPSVSTPPRATATNNRLTRPPAITRTGGVVRRKSASQMPSTSRSNGARTMSVSSRVSRSASVPWV